MTDLLQKGSEWLEGQRSRFMTRPVTYLRGAGEVAVQATVGRTVFRVDAAYGARERHESRDYLVLAADLIFVSGVPILPKAGDQIREVEGSKAFLYEVMAPGGEPPWRYSDLYRETLRIHTKLIGMEDLTIAVDLGLSAGAGLDLPGAGLLGGVSAAGGFSSAAELERLGLSVQLAGSLSLDEAGLLADMILSGAVRASDVEVLGAALSASGAAGVSLVDLVGYAILNGVSAALGTLEAGAVMPLSCQGSAAASELGLGMALGASGGISATSQLSSVGGALEIQVTLSLQASTALDRLHVSGLPLDAQGSAALTQVALVGGLDLTGTLPAVLSQMETLSLQTDMQFTGLAAAQATAAMILLSAEDLAGVVSGALALVLTEDQALLAGPTAEGSAAISQADIAGEPLSAIGIVTALFELQQLGLDLPANFAGALLGQADLAMPQVALDGVALSGSGLAVASPQADMDGPALSGAGLAGLQQPVELLGGVSASGLAGLHQAALDGVALSGAGLAVVSPQLETTVGALSGSASVGLASAVLTTLTTDLAFACKLDETSGTDITDWKGGKIGTISGGYTLNEAGPSAGIQSILFDGSTAFIAWTNAVLGGLLDMGSGSGSWEIWFKTSSGAAQTLLNKSVQSGGRFSTVLVAPNASTRGIILSGGGGPFANGGSRDDGLWHQAVVVRDSPAGRFKLYEDGGLQANVATAIGSTNNAGDLFAGKFFENGQSSEFFNGHLALPRVWVGRALSAADVTALWNAGAGLDIST